MPSRTDTLDLMKPALPRRAWRGKPEAPTGALVDIDLSAPSPAGATDVPARMLDPAPVVDWRSSSYDLLNGLEVNDDEASIPGDLFDELFKR